MEIIFHAHRAVISDRMRERAERAIVHATRHLPRAVGATVRFEQDGPTRRVEIVVLAPRHRRLVAQGEARYYGLALGQAAERLRRQTVLRKKTVKAASRRLVRV
jgi:hypothetical protein